MGHSEFLRMENELSEFDYKKRQVANKKIMQHALFMKQLNKMVFVWIGMASALIGLWDIQRHFERANQKVRV